MKNRQAPPGKRNHDTGHRNFNLRKYWGTKQITGDHKSRAEDKMRHTIAGEEASRIGQEVIITDMKLIMNW